jgi:lipopolysaccharide transport system ATP-binding protein
MSDIVIKAENLGKKYVIGHQAERVPYLALRDVLMQNARTLWNKTKDLAMGRPIIQGDTTEEVWALKDVSFEVKRGEAVGIIGRNGAGKSTLLKILSRITEPTAGRVTIKGRVASLLEVGTGFHPELTGRENIYLNGAILGMTRKEIRRKFDEIVAFAEVEKYLDTPVKRYSSGMYVRLAFAVAAHLEPEILLVDEVLAVGDAAFQKKCLGKMGDVSKEGRTVLFVSHNMGAINNLCRWGMWLDEGRLQMEGTVASMVTAYLSAGAEEEGERRWENLKEAPGNETIRLRAIRVLNSNRQVRSTVDMRFPFYVEIEYEVLIAHSGIRTGFWVLSSDGVLIFVAGDNEDLGWQDKRSAPGSYVSTCEIPGMLLNSGTYVLTVAADIPGSEMLFLEKTVMKFHIEHTGVTVLDGSNRSPGIICPSLQWHISKCEGIRK